LFGTDGAAWFGLHLLALPSSSRALRIVVGEGSALGAKEEADEVDVLQHHRHLLPMETESARGSVNIGVGCLRLELASPAGGHYLPSAARVRNSAACENQSIAMWKSFESYDLDELEIDTPFQDGSNGRRGKCQGSLLHTLQNFHRPFSNKGHQTDGRGRR
jgi:hypothetical protein